MSSTTLSSDRTVVVSYRHSCSTCGKAFQRATGLERHKRSAHTKVKPYACEFCSQAFTRTDLLQRHVSLYHKDALAGKNRVQDTLDTLLNQNVLEQDHTIFPTTAAKQQDHNLGSFSLHQPQSVGTSQQLQEESPIPVGQSSMSAPSSSISMPNNLVDVAGPLDIVMDENYLSWFCDNLQPTASETSSWSPSSHHPTTIAMPSSSPSKHSRTHSQSDHSSTATISPVNGLLLSEHRVPEVGTHLVPDPSATAHSDELSNPWNGSREIGTRTWPSASTRHLDLYRINFANHVPFVHLPTLYQIKDELELDEDLTRAMAIIGGNYDNVADVSFKWCDFYGCGSLKTKMQRSVEEIQDSTAAGINQRPSKRVLMRRTQTLVLTQLVAMFSESNKHRMAAKLSHGTLIAVARELLKDFEHTSWTDSDSWTDWVAREEIVRTIWAVYIVDCLQSFCYRRAPWFSMSELYQLPDLGSDQLWQAPDQSAFHRLYAREGLERGANDGAFDLVGTLKDKSADLTLLQRPSLSENLLALVTISTEITTMMHTDLSSRRQLAKQFQRVLESNHSPRHQSSFLMLHKKLHALNANLQNHLGDFNWMLSQWLTFLQNSTSEASAPLKGQNSFMSELMPWYWVCVHLLGVLRQRLVGPHKGNGSPISSSASGDSDSGGTTLDQSSFNSLLEHSLPTHAEEKAVEELQMLLSSFSNTSEKEESSQEIMHLLVRVRLALRRLDGGASMQFAIGTPQFSSSLPQLPAQTTTCSITLLFPQMAVM